MKGDIDRTAEPNWPKGYSRPCIVMPKKKLGELAGQCSLLIRDCLGMCHWVVSSCVVHHLICILSQHCNKFPFLFCPVKLFISTHQFNIFFRSFPHPTEGDEGKWLCGVQLPAGINHSNHSECIFKYQILFRNTKGDKYFLHNFYPLALDNIQCQNKAYSIILKYASYIFFLACSSCLSHDNNIFMEEHSTTESKQAMSFFSLVLQITTLINVLQY